MRRVLGPHLENMTSEASLVPPFFPSTRKSFAAEVKNSWGLARSESVCGNTLSQRSTELQRGPEVDPEAMLLRWLGPWGARVGSLYAGFIACRRGYASGTTWSGARL